MQLAGLTEFLEFIPAGYRPYLLWGGVVVLGLLIIRNLALRLGRALRRRRPPTIHPRLQKYNQDHAALDQQRREDAARIIATSTGPRLAGFRIVRQVEAVFVDGYRTPEDAIVALKAAAAAQGANAILNVSTQRSAAGKCSASGDAVVAAPPAELPPQPPRREDPSPL